MAIECNEIQQNINYLLTAFEDCSKLKASDMQLLVELIAAVNICSNGGPDYNTVVSQVYEPEIDQIISFPINTFHAISLAVVNGTGIYNGITLTPGTSINLELTTLNQTIFTFTARAGSKILINYIIETV